MPYLSPHQSPERRQARASTAARQFDKACDLAEEHRFILRQCTHYHYQLLPYSRKWLINIYPSNRRLYGDQKRPGPRLPVSAGWDLLEVVRAAIQVHERG
jgi:hypothetical protein